MDSSKELLYGYLRLSRQIQSYFRDRYRGVGLTDLQCMALAILECTGPMPVSGLAEQLGCANSTVSGVIDRLEEAGAVTRTRSEMDRRVIFVSLTEKTLSGSNDSRFPWSCHTLSAPQQEDILRSFQLFARALEAESGRSSM